MPSELGNSVLPERIPDPSQSRSLSRSRCYPLSMSFPYFLTRRAVTRPLATNSEESVEFPRANHSMYLRIRNPFVVMSKWLPSSVLQDQQSASHRPLTNVGKGEVSSRLMGTSRPGSIYTSEHWSQLNEFYIRFHEEDLIRWTYLDCNCLDFEFIHLTM